MGIDIFLLRDGEKVQEDDKVDWLRKNQGHVGYLREEYHGGPYATQLLVDEAFESLNYTAKIPAAVLRQRLTTAQNTQKAVAPRVSEQIIYALRVLTEKNKIAGVDNTAAKNPAEEAQNLLQQITPELLQEAQKHIATLTARVPKKLSVLEAAALRERLLYDKPDEEIEDCLHSFIDFVELAERIEEEQGSPGTIYAWF